MGWTKLDEDYENGYYGQEDDPNVILKKIKADKPDCRVLFSIEYCNPFAVGFATTINVRQGTKMFSNFATISLSLRFTLFLTTAFPTFFVTENPTLKSFDLVGV